MPRSADCRPLSGSDKLATGPLSRWQGPVRSFSSRRGRPPCASVSAVQQVVTAGLEQPGLLPVFCAGFVCGAAAGFVPWGKMRRWWPQAATHSVTSTAKASNPAGAGSGGSDDFGYATEPDLGWDQEEMFDEDPELMALEAEVRRIEGPLALSVYQPNSPEEDQHFQSYFEGDGISDERMKAYMKDRLMRNGISWQDWHPSRT